MERINHRTGPRLAPRSLLLLLLLLLLVAAGCAHQPAAGGAKAPPAAVKITPEVKVELVTPPALIPLTLDQARFGQWGKRIIDALKPFAARHGAGRKIVLLAALRKRGGAKLKLGASPPLDPSVQQQFLAQLRALSAPPSRRTDYHLYFVATDKAAPRAASKRTDEIIANPLAARLQRYKRAGLKEQIALLKQWLGNEAFPVLAGVAGAVNPKFVGVQKTLAKLNLPPQLRGAGVVQEIADRSPDFWRGLMEMARSNQLVAVVPALLHAALGELDQARFAVQLIRLFSTEQDLARYLVEGLHARLAIIFAGVERRVRMGVALHDKGDYQGAAKVYSAVLEAYPCSAWARYELFLSRMFHKMLGAGSNARARKKARARIVNKDWAGARQAVFACDPLYPVEVQMQTGTQAYLGFRRMGLRELFKDKARFATDLVTLAETSLELGQWRFAGQVYWLAATHLKLPPARQKELLEHFLYCLEQLGVTGIKKTFKGDHQAAFRRIERQRRAAMLASPLYKAMKKK